MSVSGYRVSSRSSERLMQQFQDEDLQFAGSAVVIAGSVNEGVFFGRTAAIKFLRGGAGIQIGGEGGSTISIGATSLPDDFLAPSGEEDDDTDRKQLNHAIVNQGAITATGTIDGADTIAFLVAGLDDNNNIRAVILEGDGFLNEGAIRASANDGDAVGLTFGSGSQASALENTGANSASGLIGYEANEIADDWFRGESQRIRLASQIGSGLTGVFYVLDEPSICLHQRDNTRLLDSLRGLRDLGNTVIVVEHDEEAIETADYVVDLGAAAGVHGGKIAPPEAGRDRREPELAHWSVHVRRTHGAGA